jgi:predicted PurR-regulated permease PerM
MFLVIAAALVIVLAGLRDIGSLLGPVFLALTLAVAARPAGHWLRARGVPRWLSTVLVLVLLYVVLVGMLAALALAVTQLVGVLPDYAAQFTNLWQGVLGWLADHGIHEDAITRATREVNVGTVVGVAQGVLSSLTSGATGALFLLLSVAFLVIDTAGIEARVKRVRAARPQLAAAVEDFTGRVRRY